MTDDHSNKRYYLSPKEKADLKKAYERLNTYTERQLHRMEKEEDSNG